LKKHITYTFDHIGIPTNERQENERYSEQWGVYTADSVNSEVQWHRFAVDSALHPLIKSKIHTAYRVENLDTALVGEEILLPPYEPIDGYRVAFINWRGKPIELIETCLTPAEAKSRALAGQGLLYRGQKT
jgi:hypothetical protein